MTNDNKQPEASTENEAAASQERLRNEEAIDQAIAEDEMDEVEPDSVESVLGELADLKDKYIRLAAEMDNLRKRTDREKTETAKYAISGFARDILSLSDNFQRAISAVPEEAAEKDEALGSFLEGVMMNERELQKVLERHGVLRVDPQGEKFDPNQHQAVQQIENPELPNNTVCDVYQVGYMIADRVLRHAVVSVSKGGPKAAVSAAETEPETPPEPTQTANEPVDQQDVGSTVDKNA